MFLRLHFPGRFLLLTPRRTYRYNIDGDELPRYEGVLVDRWTPPKPAPFLTPFVGAGLIFGSGEWVDEVPFDPYLDYLFSGEELLHSVCACSRPLSHIHLILAKHSSKQPTSVLLL